MRVRSPVVSLAGLAGAALLGAFAVSGCGDPPRGPVASSAGVIVVCFDTLRADAVLDGDAPAGRIHALDAFAKQATAFRDARSAASWTPPGVASILTGLELASHGVRGVDAVPSLPPAVRTLAETFQAAGWHTAASTAGHWVDRPWGFAQGFDHFDTRFDEDGPDAVLRAWAAQRPKDRPFFLFLHTLAPHSPYGRKGRLEDVSPERRAALEARVKSLASGLDCRAGAPPPPFETMLGLAEAYFVEPLAAPMFGRHIGPQCRDRIWAACEAWLLGDYALDPRGPPFAARLRDAYVDGLSWVDDVATRTFRALEEVGVPAGTVTVVVADHGEAFGEHRMIGHGPIVEDEVARVPLLVRAPAASPGRVVRGACGTVDVAPTVLHLAGLPIPPGLDGRSLVPFLAADATDDRPVVTEADRRLPIDGFLAIVRRFAVRTARFEHVLTIDVTRRRAIEEVLFDLVADPGETMPLSPERLDRGGAAFVEAVARVRRGALGP